MEDFSRGIGHCYLWTVDPVVIRKRDKSCTIGYTAICFFSSMGKPFDLAAYNQTLQDYWSVSNVSLFQNCCSSVIVRTYLELSKRMI